MVNQFYDIFIIVYVIVIGLLIGSFLNVCIYRIPNEKSIIKPPSSCGSCGTRLKPLDLIPVFSYIFLGGKCRYCKKRFSSSYMIVELINSIIYTLAYFRYGISAEMVFSFFLISLLIIVTFIDLDTYTIPDGLVITGLIGGAVLFLYHIFVGYNLFTSTAWYYPLLGMISSSGILFIIAIIGLIIYGDDGAMGMGDVKIMLPVGLFLGVKLCLTALFIGILMGGILGVVLLIFKKKKGK